MIRIRLRWEENAVKLAARLCEKLAANAVIPILNRSQIILDDTSALVPPKINEIYRRIMMFRSEAKGNVGKMSGAEDEVGIEDEKPRKEEHHPAKFFVCPHCGYITPYEEEYWVHLKTHYLGF